jgi:mRNA interferase MazF
MISTTTINERRRTVVVIPLSGSSKVAPPLTVAVECSGRQVVAVLDQVRAVAKERLTGRIEDMPRQQLEAVERGLREILELF